MSDDIYVGFTEQPEGIDTVLRKKGFERVSGRKNIVYEQGELGIDAIFRSQLSQRQRFPKWDKVLTDSRTH